MGIAGKRQQNLACFQPATMLQASSDDSVLTCRQKPGKSSGCAGPPRLPPHWCCAAPSLFFLAGLPPLLARSQANSAARLPTRSCRSIASPDPGPTYFRDCMALPDFYTSLTTLNCTFHSFHLRLKGNISTLHPSDSPRKVAQGAATSPWRRIPPRRTICRGCYHH